MNLLKVNNKVSSNTAEKSSRTFPGQIFTSRTFPGHKKNSSTFSGLLEIPGQLDTLPHIKTSQLICNANQLLGFYMRPTLAFNGLRASAVF